ncbi:MAG: HAD family hydrolase [Mariprofundaceae bacterium]|nr:HAD family hydrolase [Mariprofundaceae bacterium]
MQVKAVLLDMDGTLVDAFKPIITALNQTLKDFGLPQMSDEDVKRHTGRGECSMISLFGDEREAASKCFLEYHDQHLFEIKPMAGAETLLDWLTERGITSAIVTSKSQIRADKQIEYLGWSGKIDTVIGMLDGRKQKPDPHTIHLACNALRLPPADTIMVGDGTADMKAAKRAGSMPVGLAHSFSNDELLDAGATRCFDSLSEVQAWLTQQIN